MLTTLRIKNLALVTDLTLDLQAGFNAITGETGAGKSIILGALNLVLGERADRTLIRSGCDSCTVEAVFEVSRLRAPLKNFLSENGLEPCEDSQLVLKRAFTAAGANRQFINGSPTTLATLANLGEWLVDIHGPHDHQSLLHPARQLDILDAFGGLEPCRQSFAELVRQRNAVEAEKSALIVDEQTYAQQLDLLRFQVNEISSAKLQPDEFERVDQDYRRASNGAKLIELCQAASGLLSENENAILSQAGLIGRLLQELQRLDPSAVALGQLHEQSVSALRELQDELGRYAERVDVDPTQLAALEQRMDLLQSLKRKYGASISEVIAFGQQAERKLQNLEQRDKELERLNASLAKIDSELGRVGRELTEKRRALMPKLAKAAKKQLADLGFVQSEFSVAISSDAKNITATGFDTIEFQFAPNPGEPARPLRAIASSGEMSRVMLALKTVLAAQDDVLVLVFDEVDTNIGGVTASAVAEKMAQIGQQHQVLCITHLAPVAAAAHNHYFVSKQVKDGRTASKISLLERPDRIEELARMLGGPVEAARKHAEALLK